MQTKLFRGVRDLILVLKRSCFALGIVTSCKKDELGCYGAAMGILGPVDAVACGDDASRGKLHPHLYCAALRKLGVMEASSCLAVGDSPHDAMAARTAGLHADGWFLAREAHKGGLRAGP
jgi:phosphoglycolate phosphatase-like HAD superfamily hydrolase